MIFRYEIGVFCKSELFLDKTYEKALKEIPNDMIGRFRSYRSTKEIILKDGSSIKFVKPTSNTRGMKFDRVIIDEEIEQGGNQIILSLMYRMFNNKNNERVVLL